MDELRVARFDNFTTPVSGFSLVYFIFSIAGFLTTPRTVSLATSAISALLVWIYASTKTLSSSNCDRNHPGPGWAVGGLLGLAQACQRTAGEGAGLWWSQALVPWAVLVTEKLVQANWGTHSSSGVCRPVAGLFLVLATGSAAYGLGWRTLLLSDATLGVCFALLQGIAITILSMEFQARPTHLSDKLEFVDSRDPKTSSASDPRTRTSIKSVSGALAIVTGLASLSFEGPWDSRYVTLQDLLDLIQSAAICAPALLMFLVMVIHRSPFEASLWRLGSVVLANLISRPVWSLSCLGAVTLQGLICTHTNATVKAPTKFSNLSWSTLTTATIFFSFQLLRSLSAMGASDALIINQEIPTLDTMGGSIQIQNSVHPIKYLVAEAEQRFNRFVDSQSKTLGEVVAKYEQRYGIPPPPHFDRWYDFAMKHEVQIYDDYDIIHDAMQPFWALRPFNIRARVQESIGADGNALIVLMIRNGRITKLEGGLEWQHEAIRGMLESFVNLLPDLDVAFNAHDEPRIIIPYDELSRIVLMARQGPMNDAFNNKTIVNSFSPRPADMTDGYSAQEYKSSRFNEYAHQNTWVPSRLSCPPDSPARSVNEDQPDSTTTYELGPLGFIYNHTASTDICQIPSLHGTHAFFDRPNAFNVAHDLIPIFSESKISSFQDIPFPSMWHWYGKLFLNRTEDMHIYNVPSYDPAMDIPWSEKSDSLYWRGSTTGAWSQDGGWRRHHRQRLLQLLNSPGQGTVLHNTASNTSSVPLWRLEHVKRPELSHLLNVSFTGIGQCAENDCRAQREFFHLSEHVPLSTAWRHKHLLDMDGNAFSARFYALLRSNSLVYKAAIFREWHDEWLVPWLHYIPLSITGRDALEAVRFFAMEPEGQHAARRLAARKKEWAERALRRVDMESWMFRCLLEYARVVDDNRSGIGFVG